MRIRRLKLVSAGGHTARHPGDRIHVERPSGIHLLIFAYLAIFQWRDLLTTRLGNITAIAISIFWFLRGINQVVFYELTAADMPLFGLCLVFGLLHLIPVIREWKKVPSEAQGQSVNAQPAL